MKLTRSRVVTIGVAASVLAISVTSLASGVSLRKLVKKEVSKQISKAQGPAGTNGTNGANGTARAYGRVAASCPQPSAACPIDHDKGIVVRKPGVNGTYCVTATGVDPTQVAAVATVDTETADYPNLRASVDNNSVTCTANEFAVVTTRNSVAAGVLTWAWVNDVAFTIVIP